jgi:hypothetical protein
VFVADLRHYLDLPDCAAGPARRLADQLTSLVQAATARPAGAAWETTIPCRRRPSRRACTGRLTVSRSDVPRSWADLRSDPPGPDHEVDVVVPIPTAALLQDVTVLDSDCNRLVRGARVADGSAILTGPVDALEELLGYVAAEANHTPSPVHRRKLDDAYAKLDRALSHDSRT